MARLSMGELTTRPLAVGQYPNLSRLFKPQGKLVQMMLNGNTANELTLSVKLKFNPNTGTVSVYHKHEYCGRLTQDGTFHSSLNQCTPLWRGITDLLHQANADPIGIAGRFGIEGGHCGCCGRPLTDPTSIKIGIGPICLRFMS